MKNKIVGFTYRYSNSESILETYTVVYEDGKFLYMPIKTYEKDIEKTIDELEKVGFKNMSYWDNYITDFVRDEISKVRK